MNTTERKALQDLIKSQNQKIDDLETVILQLKTKITIAREKVKSLSDITLKNHIDVLEIFEKI